MNASLRFYISFLYNVPLKNEHDSWKSLVLAFHFFSFADRHAELRANSIACRFQKFRVKTGAHYQIVQIAIVCTVIEYREPIVCYGISL